MQQICDGYNPKVCMGNWYEESYSVSQPSREAPAKMTRHIEIDIGYVDANLKLRPLNRIGRLQPWNTDGLVNAPQFKTREAKSTFKENFDLVTVQNHFKEWKPFLHDKSQSQLGGREFVRVNNFPKEHRMFNEHNVNQLLRPREVDQKCFKNELTQNRQCENKQLLQTIYQRDISRNQSTAVCDNQLNQTVASCPGLSQFRRMRSEITLKSTMAVHTAK